MPTGTVETRVAQATTALQVDGVALIASGKLAEAIAGLLCTEGFSVATFESVEALLTETAEFSAAILSTDDTGPALTRAIEPLRRGLSQTKVVVLCPSMRGWEVHATLGSGAVGIVLHDEMDRALGACIRAVQADQVCVPRRHSGQIEPPALSSREKQILGLVVMGYMNGQIAERLFLAESTIKSHLSSAFGKLGVRSRHEAVNLILHPDGGLGLGILGLGGEPIDSTSA